MKNIHVLIMSTAIAGQLCIAFFTFGKSAAALHPQRNIHNALANQAVNRDAQRRSPNILTKKIQTTEVMSMDSTDMWPGTKRLDSDSLAEKTIHTKNANQQSLGEFLLTAYTIDASCTGKTPNMADYGVTASGTHATVNRTIAVDPSIIPYGSLVWIEGVGLRVAEDTGGAIRGHHIDILLSTHHDAIEFGVKHHRRVVLLNTK